MTIKRLRIGVASAAVLAAVALAGGISYGDITGELINNTTASVNTRGWEDSPFLTPDGTRLYFMYTPWQTWPIFFGRSPYLAGPDRIGHHINPDRNPWEDSDVYVSTRRRDGTFSTPSNLGFNDVQADCCLMTWATDQFVYQRTQWPNAGLTDIYFVRRTNGRWIRESAGPAVNDPSSSESNPHVTADGQLLFFTSNRQGGFGKHDLYWSARTADNTWGPPQNLGPAVNTAESEDQIWVSGDKQTIYFNREPGPHVLTAARTGSAWETPRPVHFGSQLVAGAEVSLTADGTTMVLATVRPDLEDILLVQVRRLPDQTWGAPTALQVR